MNTSTVESTVGNISSSSSQQLLPRSEGIAFCMAFLVESIAIVIGNLITIAAFTRSRRIRKRKFYLLMNLAIADFLVGAIVLPWWVYYLAQKFDLWHCKQDYPLSVTLIESFIQLTTFASLINLTMVSLERMYATLWPLKHRVLGKRSYYVLIGLSWTLPIVVPSVNATQRYKLISPNIFYYLWLSFMCCLLLIICTSYVTIWIKMKCGRTIPLATTLKNRKLTRCLSLVTAVSLVTWLPASVVYIAYRHGVSSVVSSHDTFIRIYYSAVLLWFANSLVNPIIYALRMPQFRRASFRLVFGRSPRRRQHVINQRGMRNEGFTS